LRIVGIGEILWDVFENEEHLGGAVFNLAAQSARLGHDVYYVSAVGLDERGGRALERMRGLGLPAAYVGRVSQAPTGVVTVTVDGGGQPSYVIHRPAAYDFAELTAEELAGLVASRPDWICFGTLYQMHPNARALTRRLLEANPDAPRFYDVNLRRDSYTPELVRELLAASGVVKLNDGEVAAIREMLALPGGSIEEFCRRNAEVFGWRAVCVTQGDAGCCVLDGREFVESPGYEVTVADAVGAGDAFSAAFLHGLGSGWPIERTADFANRVGAFIASRSGGTPEWSLDVLDAELPSRLGAMDRG